MNRILRTQRYASYSPAGVTRSQSTAALDLYGHYVSQPARACAWLMKIEDISFNFKRVEPMKGDCKKKEFLEKFPTGLSPAIEVAGSNSASTFKLTEGTSILQYICEVNKLEQWWPTSATSSSEERALLASYLSSHHSTTRMIQNYVSLK